MSFCNVCGEEIGNANFCSNCGTAQDNEPPQSKNLPQPPTFQTQAPSQQGMQGMMQNISPMMIIMIIAMIIMMVFMFIFIFPTIFNFMNR
ncbi:MAG: hypothetical protein HeimC3_21900 [Candidatus Heimdallarchaeota archaeon LC_3]|nr:MAG: hypothetical protein HeimC3_21900 [Candidatus Heimdallarchaeota archaeon LC_3]